MRAPGLGLQAPAEALRSRGKQVLGLAGAVCGDRSANGGGQALAMVLRAALQASLPLLRLPWTSSASFLVSQT